MFDPAQVRALLASRQAGHTLPQPFYTDPALFAFDLQAVFARVWLFAGLDIELPRPSGVVTRRIGPTSVLLARGADGAIRGFFNTCRHRGAQICQEASSRVARLTCPYHQWTYGLDGRLLAAAGMPRDFDRGTHGLLPVHVETVAGVLFLCLAEAPPDFAPIRAALEPLLAPHGLADAKVAFESTIVEKGNWKLVMENARECYHCDARHPELMRSFPDVRKWGVDDEAARAFLARCRALGLPTGLVKTDGFDARRFPLRDGARSFTLDGKPAVSRTLGQVGDGDIGSLRFALEPNSFAHVVGDHAFLFWLLPLSAQETQVTMKWVVAKDAVEGVDYDLERLTHVWNVTNDQDVWLVENNQRGVNSQGYRPGPYSSVQETPVQSFVDWYCRMADAALRR